MTTDSFFALAVAGLLALFLGSVLAFAGYRFFLGLLPVLGFLFGFVFGAQAVQAVFGVREQAGAPILETTQEALRQRGAAGTSRGAGRRCPRPRAGCGRRAPVGTAPGR